MAMAQTDARARVVDLITGCWGTQVVHVAVRLKVFDLLAQGPRAAADLSAETGSNASAFLRLMRALAAVDLVRHLDGDRFELTEGGQLLPSDAPGSIRGMALHWGERLWGALSQLDQSVKTGEPWRISGLGGFQHMASDPDQMAMFHQSMTDQTSHAAAALLGAYDFGRFGSVMDVGGSYGALLAAVLKAHPQLTGQVFDLPDLAATSSAYLAGAGVSSRGRFVGGSFFDEVPPGADVYMLKTVIHDWDNEKSVAILANCRKAAGQGGKVLLIERIAPKLVEPEPDQMITTRGDILMLTAAGGIERTEDQYRELFARAGLRLATLTATPSGHSIMEAVAA